MVAKVTVEVKAEAVIALLKGFRQKFRAALWQKIQRLAIEVQQSVKEDKLTGQVLHVRTGTLRRSINQRVEEHGSGIRAIIGTNVEYAPAHEFGFSGVVQMRAHIRKIKQGQRTFSVQVPSYSRKMNLPERSFLRSTLNEYVPRIREELASAALEVLKK